jgi:hypothetical protein
MSTAIRNDKSDSELAKAQYQSDPARAQWSTIESMLASLIDEIRYANWMYASVHSDGNVPKPEPIRRPGITGRRGKIMSLSAAQKIDPRLRGMSEEEAQAFLDRMMGKGR